MSINFSLPLEIVSEILLLLPFQSILASKLVCKDWNNLIKDPKFPTRYHPKGSIVVSLHGGNLFCILLRHSNNETTEFPSHTVHRIRLPVSKKKVVFISELLSGWSNGIACVKDLNDYFYLYNMFTGVSHTVDDAPKWLNSGYWIYYGFGYDFCEDDHKIMVLSDDKNNEKTLLCYSSRNGTWKQYTCDDYPWHQYWPRPCYSFNGVLYFILSRTNQEIMTYDLHTRRFGVLLGPEVDKDVDYLWINIGEADGRLCYTYCSPENEWVLEVYDGRQWRKRARFYATMRRDGAYLAGLQHTELYEMGDGREIGLFVSHNSLFWNDFSKKESQEIRDVYFTWVNRISLL